MRLAALKISVVQFDYIYDHIANHRPKYSNLHLRDTKQVDRQRVLRYLHILVAKEGNVIEAAVSGEDIYCRYQIKKTSAGTTQINVIEESGNEKELERFADRLLNELYSRIEMEKAGQDYFPKRKGGQFYLRRWEPGIALSHPTCQLALKMGALHKPFLELLYDWKFELFRGKGR